MRPSRCAARKKRAERSSRSASSRASIKICSRSRRSSSSGELGKIYYIQTGGWTSAWNSGQRFQDFVHRGRNRGRRRARRHRLLFARYGSERDRIPEAAHSKWFQDSFFRSRPPKLIAIIRRIRSVSRRFSALTTFAGALIRLEGDVIVDFRIAWAMNVNTPGDTIILGTKAGLRIPST